MTWTFKTIKPNEVTFQNYSRSVDMGPLEIKNMGQSTYKIKLAAVRTKVEGLPCTDYKGEPGPGHCDRCDAMHDIEQLLEEMK